MALQEMLPALQAKRKIDEGNYDATNYQQVYELWLRAYGDEELAQQAKSKAVQLYVDKACGGKI